MRHEQIAFDDFVLDPATAALSKGGRTIPLQLQPARLLLFIVEREGAIVTREEIRAHLWGDTVVAYDQSINYCVRQIRKALGGAEAARLLQTVPRQGYRFTAAVTRRPLRARGLSPALRIAAASLLVGLMTGIGVGVALNDETLSP